VCGIAEVDRLQQGDQGRGKVQLGLVKARTYLLAGTEARWKTLFTHDIALRSEVNDDHDSAHVIQGDRGLMRSQRLSPLYAMRGWPMVAKTFSHESIEQTSIIRRGICNEVKSLTYEPAHGPEST
jgi:hypothetical protein